MKLIIEIDATPKEVREAVGLPDIQAVQDRVIDKIEDRVMTTINDLDPTNLLKIIIPEGLGILDGLQKTILENLSIGGSRSSDTK